MKRLIFVLLLILVNLVGCINRQTEITNTTNLKSEEASWAYPFVKYKGESYKMTDEKVKASVRGERIGEVKRNIVDMDVEENLEVVNFDSNELDIGTPLFEHKGDSSSILFEINEEYFKATKIN